ncbi:MAG: hypothetical protein GY820_24270 [Gammaproteobacteria bacterium]|nr:hypothetical protein [Gammaproteobacteria bacterium]
MAASSQISKRVKPILTIFMQSAQTRAKNFFAAPPNRTELFLIESPLGGAGLNGNLNSVWDRFWRQN